MAKKRQQRDSKGFIPPDTYRIYRPDDGPEWESLQALEDDYWFRKDVEDQNSGECPYGHRDGVTPTPEDLPGRREGMGDWWCTKHELQFGERNPETNGP